MDRIVFVYATEKEKKVGKSLYNFGKHRVLGIGMLASAIELGKIFHELQPRYIINIGICALADKAYACDLIEVRRSLHVETKKECISSFGTGVAPVASMACSEKMFLSKNEMLGEKYGDMESYSILKSCQAWNIPCLILKVPYDVVGKETRDINYDDACEYMRKILPSSENLLRKEPLFEATATFDPIDHIRFHLSVTETHMFQALLLQYKILSASSDDHMIQLCKAQTVKKQFQDFLLHTISSYQEQ